MSSEATDIPAQPRLASDVEAFPASDGRIYLLRGGPEPDLVIEDAGPGERALLAALTEGLTPAAHLDGDGLAALAKLGLLRAAPSSESDSRLSAEERARYDRQLPYLAGDGAGGAAAQEGLREARVAILGVGGLGSWTLCGLACAGVGHLRIVDFDTIELSNLNRQLLYRRADVGRPKVEVAAEAITQFNPSIAIEPVRRRIAGLDDAHDAVAGTDLVVATADWPMYDLARWVDRACTRAGIPWIAAGQVPPLVRVGPLHVPGTTGCFECQERAGRRAFALYDELAAWRQAHSIVDTTLGWASGVIGSLLAGEVVHALTRLVEPATTGTAITLDLRTLEVSRERLERDPECPVCGS
jgi:bacteriocin biosynthesis cyclodehydratase domain-containing protein